MTTVGLIEGGSSETWAASETSAGHGAPLRVAFALRQLVRTIEHARIAIPHYRGRWPDLDLGSATLDILDRLPILTRSDVAQSPLDFVSLKDAATGFIETSGTTSRPLIVYFNQDETRHQIELLKFITGSRPRTQEPGIHLRFTPTQRRVRLGTVPETDRRTIMINYVSFEYPNQETDSTDFVCEVLGRTYYIDNAEQRVTSMHVTSPETFEVLTDKLLTRGLDPALWSLKHVALSGGPVTPKARRQVTEIWKAHLATSYSSTESGVDCRESATVPGLYYCHPACIYEVLDERDNQCRPGECGRLVITTLAPYRTVMPFIRYDTNDIVRVVELEASSSRQLRSFEYIGRRDHAVRVTSSAFFGSSDAIEAIGETPIIPSMPFPKFTIRLAGGRLELKVEGQVGSERRWAETATAIRRNAIDRLLTLGASDVPVDVSIVPKSSLADPIQIYPSR